MHIVSINFLCGSSAEQLDKVTTPPPPNQVHIGSFTIGLKYTQQVLHDRQFRTALAKN